MEVRQRNGVNGISPQSNRTGKSIDLCPLLFYLGRRPETNPCCPSHFAKASNPGFAIRAASNYYCIRTYYCKTTRLPLGATKSIPTAIQYYYYKKQWLVAAKSN